MKTKTLLLLFFVFNLCFSQVGIQTDMPNEYSNLELGSSDKGLLLNRVDILNKDISTPLSEHKKGMLLYSPYDTKFNDPGLFINNGERWITMYGNANSFNTYFWSIYGNTINSPQNSGTFLGVVENEFNGKIDNLEAFQIKQNDLNFGFLSEVEIYDLGNLYDDNSFNSIFGSQAGRSKPFFEPNFNQNTLFGYSTGYDSNQDNVTLIGSLKQDVREGFSLSASIVDAIYINPIENITLINGNDFILRENLTIPDPQNYAYDWGDIEHEITFGSKRFMRKHYNSINRDDSNIIIGGALPTNNLQIESITVPTSGILDIPFQNNIIIGYPELSIVADSYNNNVIIGNSANNNYYMYAGGWTSISDENLKSNISDLELGLDFVTQLEPKRYKYKNEEESYDYGLIAQDVKEVISQLDSNQSLVTKHATDDVLGMQYSQLIPILINAIKENEKRINKLQLKLK